MSFTKQEKDEQWYTQGVLLATTWLDNRFLVMISTVHVVASKATDTVLRWTMSAKARLPVRAPMSLINYAKKMNFVDRVDKSNALACIRMRRCQRRYHRVIWFWYLSTVGHHNVKVIWEWLIGDEAVKALRKKHQRFGFFHWVQLQLGQGLIKEGIKEAKEECLSAAGPDAESTPSPHFMPSRKRVCRPSPQVSPVPQTHKLVPIKEIKFYDENRNFTRTLPRGFCAVCKVEAKHVGKSKYRMPDGSPCPRPYVGCSKCKVCLCEACFQDYDHEKNQVMTMRRTKSGQKL